MASTVDELVDQITLHQVDLLRLEAGTQRKAKRLFKRLEEELVQTLSEVDPASPLADTFKIKRVKKLLKQVQGTVNSSFSEVENELKGDLRGVSRLEARAVASELNSTIGARIASATLPSSVIDGIVNNTLVQGSIISDWWPRSERALLQRLETEMSIGALAGEGIPSLIRRIRGTQVPGAPRGTFVGGIMNTTTRDAESLARTSIQHIMNETRLESYRQNSDIIKGVQALVTLDLRTSDICISRSGGAWDLKTGAPMKGSPVQITFPGSPPWHWNCRTTLIPITKSFEELGIKTKGEIPVGKQASMDGQIAGDLTYEQWLRRIEKKKPGSAAKVLGVKKAKLWKQGKIKSLRQLVDQSGRSLTLEQLARKRGVLKPREFALGIKGPVPDVKIFPNSTGPGGIPLMPNVTTAGQPLTPSGVKRFRARFEPRLAKWQAAQGGTKKAIKKVTKTVTKTVTPPITARPVKVAKDLSQKVQIEQAIKSTLEGAAKTNAQLNTVIERFSERASAMGMTTDTFGPQIKGLKIKILASNSAELRKNYPHQSQKWRDGVQAFYSPNRNEMILMEKTTSRLLNTHIGAYDDLFAHEFSHFLDFKRMQQPTGFGDGFQSLQRRAARNEYFRALDNIQKQADIPIGSGHVIYRKSLEAGQGRLKAAVNDHAMSSYSLYDDNEWIAEAGMNFFRNDRGRKLLQKIAPKTYTLFTDLMAGKVKVKGGL